MRLKAVPPSGLELPRPFVRDVRRPVMEFTVPSYVLDLNFQYVDWNAAFDELIARPLGLKIGMHGAMLIHFLENGEEVMQRSVEVFAPGRHPLVDTEPIRLRTEKYGLVVFQKLATQILDGDGRRIAWALSLNIVAADRLDALWADLAARLEREVLWAAFGAGLDSLVSRLPDYVLAREALANATAGAHATLVHGAGLGNLAESAREAGPAGPVWSLESNRALIEKLRCRLGDRPGFPVARGDLDRLDDFADGAVNAVVGIDGLRRVADPAATLAELRRVLAPGGSLTLATFTGDRGDGLFRELERALGGDGEVVAGDLAAFRRAYDRLRESFPPDRNWLALVEKAGFAVRVWRDDLLEGALSFVSAVPR